MVNIAGAEKIAWIENEVRQCRRSKGSIVTSLSAY